MSVKDELMLAVAKDVVKHIQQEIERNGLEYTGQLKNSWEIKREGEDIIIGSPFVWARIMDEGRMPGKMPPIKALFPWVFQKIGGGSEEEIKRIAYAIGKKIAEKGIEPRHYVTSALFNLEKESS